MSLAAKQWNEFKEANGIINGKFNGNANTNANEKVAEWIKKHQFIDDDALSPYQRFMSFEIKRQRYLKPGLENKEYLHSAAEQWGIFKDTSGITCDRSDNVNLKKKITEWINKHQYINKDIDGDKDPVMIRILIIKILIISENQYIK